MQRRVTISNLIITVIFVNIIFYIVSASVNTCSSYPLRCSRQFYIIYNVPES